MYLVYMIIVGATVYFEIEDYNKSIDDCDRALELNPQMVKAMFRKAKCLCEKLQMEEAIKQLKAAQTIEPDNQDINKLLKEYENEVEEDMKLPLDHPERLRFNSMLTWLISGGAEFDKLKIRYYS